MGRIIWSVTAVAMAITASAQVNAAEAKQAAFGTLADGTKIEKVTLTNKNGMSATVMTLGATLQALLVPDADGVVADVVLGYDTAAEYQAKPQYFGATVGRYANRIAGAAFSLDGQSYTLEKNDGVNHLHGGSRGLDKVVWTIESVSNGPEGKVVLSYSSPDGNGGYPGNLKVTATYSLNDRNELKIEYGATTDKPTIVNISNHTFYNLAGGAIDAPDAITQKLVLHAARFTPVDKTLIPTGELRAVEGTPFDFRTGHVIADRIREGGDEQIRIGRGYDHNFVIDGAPGTMRPAVRLESASSGRVMEIETAAAGVQFYSGNFLNGTVTGKGGRIYRQGDGLCFEPQVFPDSPNHSDFPSARLDPGAKYTNTFTLRFSNASH